jgi:hypothetical protein
MRGPQLQHFDDGNRAGFAAAWQQLRSAMPDKDQAQTRKVCSLLPGLSTSVVSVVMPVNQLVN